VQIVLLLERAKYSIDIPVIVQCITRRKANCPEALATSEIRKRRDARLRRN
jgi:hypothetical protein